MSESKALVNGIDSCMDQTVSPDAHKVEYSSATEQTSSLPQVPVNSPVADSTEADVSGSSWFAGLTTVVDSPSSYPKWHNGDTAVSSQCAVTSCGANSSQTLSSVIGHDVDDNDDLEPPTKRRVLEQTSSSVEDDSVSTTGIVAPLLGQLLSSSVDDNGDVSDDDYYVDDETADDTAAHSTVHSYNDNSTELTCESSAEAITGLSQYEGLSYAEIWSNIFQNCSFYLHMFHL